MNHESNYLDDDDFAISMADQPVPRINIDVFCTTPNFAQTVKDLIADRRMSKTQIRPYMGGLSGAIDFYSHNHTPHLILIESEETSHSIFSGLSGLSELCDSSTQVILAGPMNDITLYREILRQGISEYISTPTSVIQIIDLINSLYTDPTSVPLARCYSFLGVKGGAGSSVLAQNVSWCLGNFLQEEVLLTDFDLNFGTARLSYPIEGAQSILEALVSPERVDDTMINRISSKVGPYLKLLASPNHIDQDFSSIASENYEYVLDTVRKTAQHVVLDLPHLSTENNRKLLYHSDEIVLVAEPDFASLRNLKQIYDMILRLRRNDSLPKIVLNKVGVPRRVELTAHDFETSLERPVDFVIPFEPHSFSGASNEETILVEYSKSSKATTTIENLARTLGVRAKGKSMEDSQASFGKTVKNLLKILKKERG